MHLPVKQNVPHDELEGEKCNFAVVNQRINRAAFSQHLHDDELEMPLLPESYKLILGIFQ